MPIIVRRALLSEIFQVRWDVLRPNRPREVAQFPGDEAPETIHAGAFDSAHANIACATLTRVDWQPIDPLGHHTAPQPAWQLRGMGVVSAHQGTGVGQSLLATLEQLARDAGPIRLIWCNARQPAIGFYQRQGWRIASEQFMIEDVGPHCRMLKPLEI